MYLQYRHFENFVGKGEIAHNQQFLLFSQCFLPFLAISTKSMINEFIYLICFMYCIYLFNCTFHSLIHLPIYSSTHKSIFLLSLLANHPLFQPSHNQTILQSIHQSVKHAHILNMETTSHSTIYPSIYSTSHPQSNKPLIYSSPCLLYDPIDHSLTNPFIHQSTHPSNHPSIRPPQTTCQHVMPDLLSCFHGCLHWPSLPYPVLARTVPLV